MTSASVTATQAKAAQQAEADRVEEVYRWAMVQVGAGVVNDTLATWNNTVPVDGTDSTERFIRTMAAMVGLRRSWLVDLALAYYRLIRALRTGATIEAPGKPSKNVSVEDLRQDFESAVHEIATHRGRAETKVGAKPPTLPPVSAEDRKPIKVEKPSVDIEKVIDDLADDALTQIRENLKNVSLDRLNKKVNQIDTKKPHDEVVAARKDEHATSGARAASEAERITLAAARQLTYDVSKADRGVLGWVRYSTTGTPCGWCAMLLSRGFTKRSGLYRSEKTASGNEVGEQFHTNCHCIAVPVFRLEQLNSPLFALNRQYAKEWPRVTEGLGGKDALAVWRKHIKQQNEHKTAQAAA